MERHDALETVGVRLTGHAGSNEVSRGGRNVFGEAIQVVRARPPENFVGMTTDPEEWLFALELYFRVVNLTE